MKNSRAKRIEAMILCVVLLLSCMIPAYAASNDDEGQGEPAATVSATAEDGAKVAVSGELPEGAAVEMEPVSLSKGELGEYIGADKADRVRDYVAYDISITDGDDEWQPDESVSVKVSDPDIRIGEQDCFAVAHINTDGKAESVGAEVTDDGDLLFDADGFSLYIFYTFTVDFHYGDITFSMEGRSEMLLSELFGELGIDADAADASSVTFSDAALLTTEPVYGADGETVSDWRLVSHEPFSTEEELRIVYGDGTGLIIPVTDAQLPSTREWELVTKVDMLNGGTYVITNNVTPGTSGSTVYTLDPTVSTSYRAQATLAKSGDYYKFNREITEAQQWVITPSGSGYTIKNAASGQYLVPAGYGFLSNSSAEVSISQNSDNTQLVKSSSYFLRYYSSAFSTTGSTSSSARNLRIYRLREDPAKVKDGKLELWYSGGKFYADSDLTTVASKVDVGGMVYDVDFKYIGYVGPTSAGTDVTNVVNCLDFFVAIFNSQIKDLTINMVDTYVTSNEASSGVESFGFWDRNNAQFSYKVNIVRDPRFDGPMVKVSAENATFAAYDNVTFDNKTTSETSQALLIDGKNRMSRLYGKIINSAVGSGEFAGIGVQMTDGGTIEPWESAVIENQRIALDAQRGYVRFCKCDESKPYEVNDNYIAINLNRDTDGFTSRIQKYAVDISVLAQSGVTPLVTLENAERWVAGDVIMQSGQVNEYEYGYDVDGDGQTGVPGDPPVNVDILTSDEATFKIVNKDDMSMVFDLDFQKEETGMTTMQKVEYPRLVLAANIVYNSRTGKWYPTLYAAVNDSAAGAFNDGDELIFFGNTFEPETVSIDKDNVTIRSAKAGTGDDSIAASGGREIRSGGYSANWVAVSSGETACVDVAGNGVTFGGTDSGKLTFNAARKGSVIRIEDNGTANVRENMTVTGGKAVDGAGIYIADGGTLNLSSGAIKGNAASGSGNGIYQNGTFNLSGDPAVEDDVYLPSSATSDKAASINRVRVITKAGDIDIDEPISVMLGDAEDNQYVGRNYVESGGSAGTVLAEDLDKFKLENCTKFTKTFTANDAVRGIPVLELTAATSLTVTKKWNDSLTTHDPVNLYLYKEGTNELVDTKKAGVNGNWTVKFGGLEIPADGQPLGYYVLEEEIDGYYSTSSRITKVVQSKDYWMPASPNQLTVGTDYLLYSNGYLLNRSNTSLGTAAVTRGMTLDGVYYPDYIPDTSVKTSSIWSAAQYGSSAYFSLKNGTYYIAYDASSGFKLQTSPGVVQIYSGSKLRLRSGVTSTSNRFLVVNGINGALSAQADYSRGSDFTLYIKKEVVSDDGYEMTITNSPFSPPPGSTSPHPNISKEIDYLGDDGNNTDTSLRGRDDYRLYLDVDSINRDKEGVDLLLIVDGTVSMTDDNRVGTDYPVTMLDEAVNGSYANESDRNPNGITGNYDSARYLQRKDDGLIYNFLSMNPNNRVGLVAFSKYKGSGSVVSTGLWPAGTNVPVGTDDGSVLRQNWTSLSGFKPSGASKVTPEDCYVDVSIAGHGTNYEAGYLKAEETLLSTNSGRKTIMVFLSDGAPNYYMDGKSDRQDGNATLCNREAYTKAKEIIDDENNNIISAAVIGFSNGGASGTAYNLLSTHASQLGGTYYPAVDTEAAREALFAAAGVEGFAPLEISDTLSEYVTFADDPDLKITLEESGTDGETILWNDNGATAGNTLNGMAVITNVIRTKDSIKVTVNPELKLLPLKRIRVSYNVTVSDEAKSEFKTTGSYPAAGDEGTDYTGNTTSSKMPGFHSNDSARAVYRDSTNQYGEGYKHPVVQVSPVYELPNAGGVGMFPFAMIGSALATFALMSSIRLMRRRKQNC